MNDAIHFDALIVGSGLAGLTVALNLAQTRRVAVISKRQLTDGASHWAQGGIAAALDQSDSADNHLQDTLTAGDGLGETAAIRFMAEHARDAIEWLIAQQVPFTRDDTTECGLHLGREGGHSHRRIVHAADGTGQAVMTALAERVRAHPNITLFESHFAIDLITSNQIKFHSELEEARRREEQQYRQRQQQQQQRCYGLYLLDLTSGITRTFSANHLVLATGGAGKAYLYTTNPDTATGDGVAIAWRAGCRVANMEFVQFHPTCLYHPYAKSFLISEAVRGEGGLLKLPEGQRFMSQHDARAELAPRDVVARAIDFEIKKRGIDCVYLDISHQPAEFLHEHFPMILSRCLKFGIDITQQPIPVVPAAHYMCGGVVTDLSGRTDIAGLYAVGEVAYTGLHGANRLASNSLLECVVMGHSAALAIQAEGAPACASAVRLPAWDESRVTDSDEDVVVSHNWDELRRLMWNYVGIVRTDKRLARAKQRIVMLRDEIHEYYANFRINRDLLELRNLVETAALIVESALSRRESRGLHFNLDCPQLWSKALPTVLGPARH